VKIRYATQATARPPTFVLFANKPADALPESYLRYLATGLRETFDLWGVPIRFHVRHRENPYDPD
jgi:GTP-binding protein